MVSSYLIVLKQLAHEEKPPKSKKQYLGEKKDKMSNIFSFDKCPIEIIL